MYEALILDFDSVVLHSEPIHYQAYNSLLGEYGITLSVKKYFSDYAGLSEKELFPKLFQNKDHPLQPAQNYGPIGLRLGFGSGFIVAAAILWPYYKRYSEQTLCRKV